MSNPKLDEVIQEALKDTANEIEFGADLFPGIKARLHCPKGHSVIPFHFSFLTTWKKVLLTTGAIFILFLACGLFSKDFRVRAADVINAVKSIFIVEGTLNDYQIVQKPVEDQLLTHSVSQTNHLSDSELSQKVGYPVSFPESLHGDFRLDYKALGVVLEKQMNYNQGREMNSSMVKAITDDQELEKLKALYGAKRDTSSCYRNTDGVTVFISIDRGSNSIPIQGKGLVSIGKARGQWHEYLFPEYPFKQENGVGSSDMSEKPVTVRISHSLTWEWNGLRYHLSFYKGNELSEAESIKVAESFMAGGK